MIVKKLETEDGILRVTIVDDECGPVTLQISEIDPADGEPEITLTQGQVKALRAWLKAGLDMQRWC